MPICETCKHAQWLLTTNGRKHPSGQGWCNWSKTVRVPAHYRQTYNDALGAPLVLGARASTIWRGNNAFTRCDVYEKEPNA